MIHNERITSEALLINCSSCVHISFTVHFGLAFASSVTLRSLTVHKQSPNSFPHALAVQMGKVECFRDCTIKQLHINCIQKNIPPFVFTPLALVSAGKVETG